MVGRRVSKGIVKDNELKRACQQLGRSRRASQRRSVGMDSISSEDNVQTRRISSNSQAGGVQQVNTPTKTGNVKVLTKTSDHSALSSAAATASHANHTKELVIQLSEPRASASKSSSGSRVSGKSTRKRSRGKSRGRARKKQLKQKPLEDARERNLVVSVKYISYQELWDWLHGEDYIQFEDEPQTTTEDASCSGSEGGHSDTPEPEPLELNLSQTATKSVKRIVDSDLVGNNNIDLVENKLAKSNKRKALHHKEEDTVAELSDKPINVTYPCGNSENDGVISPVETLQGPKLSKLESRKHSTLGKPSRKRFKKADHDGRMIRLIEEANSMTVCLTRLNTTDMPSTLVKRDESDVDNEKMELDSEVHLDGGDASDSDTGVESVVHGDNDEDANKSEPDGIIDSQDQKTNTKKKKRNYSCNFCGHIASSFYFLECHIRSHTGEKLYFCRICGEEFVERPQLVAHEHSSHPELHPEFICASCSIAFTSKLELSVHNRAHHPEPKIPKIKIKLKRRCGRPPKVLKTSEERPPEFSCPHCSRLFRLRRGLQVHISLTHNKQEETRLKCPHCPKKFDLKRGLYTHLALKHKVSSPVAANISEHPSNAEKLAVYNCRLCARVFSSLGDFQTHIKSHEMSKHPFACLECSENFETVHELFQHKTTHINATSFEVVNEFICSHCDLKFSRKDDLALHEVTHAREQPATCKITQEGSTQRYLFTVHDPALQSQDLRETRSKTSYLPAQGTGLQHSMPKLIPTSSMHSNLLTSCLPRVDSVTNSDIRQSPGFSGSTTTHLRNIPQQTVDLTSSRRNSVIRSPQSIPPMISQNTMLPNTNSEITCPRCPLKFFSHTAFATHLIEIHKISGQGDASGLRGYSSIPTPVTVQTFSCPSCTLKFVSREFLEKHMATHINERPYACPHCPDTFKYQSSLQLHQRIHAKTITFACVECPAVFGSEDDLTQHLKTHQGPPPSTSASSFSASASSNVSRLEWWKCRFCTKVYSSPAQLKAHGDAEHGIRPVPTTTTQTQQLPISILTPSAVQGQIPPTSASINAGEPVPPAQGQGQTPTTRTRCSHCGKPYAFLSALLVHERLHTGERPFECSVCKMKFRGKRNLRKHMEKRHINVNAGSSRTAGPAGHTRIMSDVGNGIGEIESVILPPNPDSDHFVMLPETGAFKFEAEERSEFEELEMEGLVFPEELAPVLSSPTPGDLHVPLTSMESEISVPPQSVTGDEILGL